MPELPASLRGCEEPMDSRTLDVALTLPGRDLGASGDEVRQPSVEALAGQDGQFTFRHVQPAAVFGRVVKLQLASQASRLVRREGSVQRCGGVDIEVVQDDANHPCVGIGLVYQPAHLLREVERCSTL